MNANKTKWVQLGNYIELCDERNSEGLYTLDDVRGISTDKKFIPTKANLDGVSLFSYKIVKPNEFAYVSDTSRRGERIALSLNDTDSPILISSIYTTFKPKNTGLLHPHYLYLLLSRSEFDRYSRFNSWGSARETFDWEELCRVQIPLPSMKVQQELVDTYNGLKSLAEQNEALIEPLSKACEAFIVNCQHKYNTEHLGKHIEYCDERNSEGIYTLDDVRGISTDKKFIPTKANLDGVSLFSYKIVKPNEFAYVSDTSRRGERIALSLNNTDSPILISSIYTAFKLRNTSLLHPHYLFLILSRNEFDRYSRFNSWGSARETFDWEELCRVQIPLPPIEVQQSIVNLYHCMEEAKKIASEAREKLKEICPALIQKAIHQ